MREKKRYLRISVESDESLDERKARSLVSQAVLEFLGELGAGEAGFAFKAFDSEKQEVVVKCSTKSLEKVIAAFSLKRFFEGKDIALRVVKVEGSFSPKQSNK